MDSVLSWILLAILTCRGMVHFFISIIEEDERRKHEFDEL